MDAEQGLDTKHARVANGTNGTNAFDGPFGDHYQVKTQAGVRKVEGMSLLLSAVAQLEKLTCSL